MSASMIVFSGLLPGQWRIICPILHEAPGLRGEGHLLRGRRTDMASWVEDECGFLSRCKRRSLLRRCFLHPQL
ncbi:MAG: hypothetical protein H6Q30_3212 [Bacteroidetes bacterium]|nr:hypothetical protein [Bacteroidota bacterium]